MFLHGPDTAMLFSPFIWTTLLPPSLVKQNLEHCQKWHLKLKVSHSVMQCSSLAYEQVSVTSFVLVSRPHPLLHMRKGGVKMYWTALGLRNLICCSACALCKWHYQIRLISIYLVATKQASRPRRVPMASWWWSVLCVLFCSQIWDKGIVFVPRLEQVLLFVRKFVERQCPVSIDWLLSSTAEQCFACRKCFSSAERVLKLRSLAEEERKL